MHKHHEAERRLKAVQDMGYSGAASRIAELEARIDSADAVARRLMIEAARDQSTVVAVAGALDAVRVALRPKST